MKSSSEPTESAFTMCEFSCLLSPPLDVIRPTPPAHKPQCPHTTLLMHTTRTYRAWGSWGAVLGRTDGLGAVHLASLVPSFPELEVSNLPEAPRESPGPMTTRECSRFSASDAPTSGGPGLAFLHLSTCRRLIRHHRDPSKPSEGRSPRARALLRYNRAVSNDPSVLCTPPAVIKI